MTIVVTPIPQLIELAAPAFTLGTANAAGSAATAVASDSTLLAFDTTDPAAVAASAVVGSATTAPHRDHVHPGIVGAGTVVDEAIARFNGTSGDSLQGYSSLSPTISDAGILNLTSGALKFPATQIVSSDANTLDDYEDGSWTPVLSDGTNNAQMSGAVGVYTKIGRMVFVMGYVGTYSLLSVSGDIRVTGLPFPATSGTFPHFPLGVTNALDMNITAGQSISGASLAGASYFNIRLWDAATGDTPMQASEWSADGQCTFGGWYY